MSTMSASPVATHPTFAETFRNATIRIGRRALRHPLVVNLTVWFAVHVLVPDGRLDIFALVVAGAALVALLRFGWNIVPVVLGAAGLGLIYRMIS